MGTRRPLVVSIFVGLIALGLDGSAQANIQSPPEEACNGKKVDDACSLPDGAKGVCKTSKCNQLDYSQGSPPKSIEVDCLICNTSGEPPGPGPGTGGAPGPSGDDGGENAGDEGAEPPPGPGPVEVGGEDDGAADPLPTANPDTPTEPPQSESRCSVGTHASPLWLGLVVVAAWRRRRR